MNSLRSNCSSFHAQIMSENSICRHEMSRVPPQRDACDTSSDWMGNWSGNNDDRNPPQRSNGAARFVAAGELVSAVPPMMRPPQRSPHSRAKSPSHEQFRKASARCGILAKLAPPRDPIHKFHRRRRPRIIQFLSGGDRVSVLLAVHGFNVKPPKAKPWSYLGRLATRCMLLVNRISRLAARRLNLRLYRPARPVRNEAI